MTGDGSSQLDTERQRVLDILTDAFAGGHIEMDDYERRATLAQQARAVADLAECVSGLPGASMPSPADQAPGVPARGRPLHPAVRPDGYPATRGPSAMASARFGAPPDLLVEDRGHGSSDVSCVMGERHMTGDWLTGDRVTSFTLMGSTVLDLRDTPLPPGRLKIDAFTAMGEITVIVPRGVPVKLSAFPFMGEAKLAGDIPRRVDMDGPWVEVGGFALMGSIIVKSSPGARGERQG